MLIAGFLAGMVLMAPGADPDGVVATAPTNAPTPGPGHERRPPGRRRRPDGAGTPSRTA